MAKETTRLNKKNLEYIARRSGQPIVQLQMMLETMRIQGRQISVSYEVVEEEK